MVAFFASTDAVQTPETTDARARARVVADGKPRAILSRRFRRTAETRRRRRHRDDDGGLKTKIISIHSHRRRFRSSTRRWRRRARTRVARSAASSPERSQVRFAVVVVVVGSSSRTHHEAILAHGARLHRDGVGRAGIGAFEGFNVVLVVRHGECVEVQSGAGGRE